MRLANKNLKRIFLKPHFFVFIFSFSLVVMFKNCSPVNNAFVSSTGQILKTCEGQNCDNELISGFSVLSPLLASYSQGTVLNITINLTSNVDYSDFQSCSVYEQSNNMRPVVTFAHQNNLQLQFDYTMPNGNVTLLLRCRAGAIESSRLLSIPIETASGGGPSWSCPSQFPTNTAFTSTATGGGTGLVNIPGISVANISGFESLRNVMGFNVNPFPNTGTSAKYLGPDTEARVFEFIVPSPFPANTPDGFPVRSRYFQFVSWPNGWHGGPLAYISISTCPGDFRIPTSSQQGTISDPTYSESCRNWRGASWNQIDYGGEATIPYLVGTSQSVSTPSSCYLTPGRKYYLNIIMSKAHYNSRRLLPLQRYCGGWENMPTFDCGQGISAHIIQ